MRAEVEDLLAADTGDEALLASGDAASAARAIGDAAVAVMLPPGSQIGPFELIEVLGEGGSSTVFRAFRQEQGVRHEVAIKVLAHGLYSTEAKHQFRREREALSRLRHPGIAHLIEGGITEDGLAYIALELVDGAPITHYARTHSLALRQRLELFLTVCRTVEAAHNALIVHRDLKPSNVLVTTEGEVKLLDFGIASLLDEETDDTSLSPLRALTPAYAAPEQFGQGPITTATDVYALGVLLDELLTGRRYQSDDSREPTSASTSKQAFPDTTAAKVVRRPRRELEHIVYKATATQPDQRYPSAGALADDIKRHLSHQPVRAHPSSRWYRMTKFITRYRAGVATLTVFLVAILLALGVALWQASAAREQAARANAVRDFLVSVFQSAGADLPTDERPTPEDLVKQATSRLLTGNNLPDAQRVDLALALAKVARSVGSYAQAMSLLDHAAPTISRLYGPSDALWWDAQILRASVLEDQARDAEVVVQLQPLQAGLVMRRDRLGLQGLRVLGNALLHSGRIDDGLAMLASARQIAGQLKLPDAQLSASIDEATALLDAEHFRAGLARADAALALWQGSDSPMDPRILDLYEAIALGAEAAGDTVRAENAYRQAITTGDRFFDKPNPQQAWNVGMYGSFLIAQGRFVDAEPYAVRGLELRRRVFGNDDPRTLYAIAAMGKLQYGQGHYKEAADWYAQGIDGCRRTSLKKLVCPRLLGLRGLAWSMAGEFDKAEVDIHAALDAQRAFDGDNNPNYAYVLEQLAGLQLARHQYVETVVTTDRVLAIYRSAKGGMIQRELGTRLMRAKALFALGRNDDALREVLDIEPKYNAMFPTGNARFGIFSLKARVLARAHRNDEAATAAHDALGIAQPPGSKDTELVAELTRIAAAGRDARQR
ncbi:protein kinase [Rhodanobacter sp. AS-Z3]|uniref:serine/threonine-protein kinase n=1 Tax=Rhodanobacter sp. AS-Z3 TaxID=3031330 RepID=UPI002479A19C|nr:serine/threonine-protein kinase [Rhodanobacter sp. AS-Z3]WEN13822.1 protein kinase [Rhodanobacter sp. AS-Z3]